MVDTQECNPVLEESPGGRTDLRVASAGRLRTQVEIRGSFQGLRRPSKQGAFNMGSEATWEEGQGKPLSIGWGLGKLDNHGPFQL